MKKNPGATERLISEPVQPDAATFDTARMASGGPGLPGRFTWRKREYVVARVLAQWTETGGCRHGSGEQYVRKHWFRVRTAGGEEMTLYFDRQSRSPRDRLRRWWLFSLREPE